MRILIVGDEKNIADGIASILRNLCCFACSIYTANDGQEACELYLHSKIDLIITDVRMSQMDGLSMIETFRKDNQTIQFIILSGYDYFPYAQRAISSGVLDYLLKPVDKDALLGAVNKAYRSLPEVYHKKQDRKLPDLPFFNFDLDDSNYPGSLRKLIAYLANNYMKDVSLQSISQDLMLNSNYLSSVISKNTGRNFAFILDYIRIKKAAECLIYEPDLSISEISYLVGYNHERRLYQVFQKRLNCTPGDFKKSYASVD